MNPSDSLTCLPGMLRIILACAVIETVNVADLDKLVSCAPAPLWIVGPTGRHNIRWTCLVRTVPWNK